MNTEPLPLPYTFQDIELLRKALTVPAPNLEREDNQRLEFLGDAVIGLLVAERLYKLYPELPEGGLTEHRNALVSGQAFLQRASRLDMTAHMRANNPRSQWQSKEIIDAIEALVGAAWLDGGRDAAEQLLNVLYTDEDFLPYKTTKIERLENPKGELLQFAQVKYKTTPTYSVLEQSGPSHAPTFKCCAYLNGVSAEGVGNTRKKAEAEAARRLLAQFESEF